MKRWTVCIPFSSLEDSRKALELYKEHGIIGWIERINTPHGIERTIADKNPVNPV